MEITSAGTINKDPAMTGFYGSYQKMKSKYRIEFDANLYEMMGYNVFLSMFAYDEKLFRPELFDMILHDCGIAALIETDTAPYTPVFCNIVGGERYADGFFRNCECYDLTGKQYSFKDWRDNEDILVFFNNLTKTPDTFISKYAAMLADLDASINNNVFFSRLKPVPVAPDQQTKNQVDQIMQDLIQNKLKTVVSDTKLKDLIDGKSSAIDVLNLTNVEHSKYIPYLSSLFDDLLSRYFMFMGLSINDSGKMAQVSRDELNKNKAASIAITNGWYLPRYEGFQIAKEKTGEDWYFDYSEIWKAEIQKTETDENGNTIPDETEENPDSQLSGNESEGDEDERPEADENL